MVIVAWLVNDDIRSDTCILHALVHRWISEPQVPYDYPLAVSMSKPKKSGISKQSEYVFDIFIAEAASSATTWPIFLIRLWELFAYLQYKFYFIEFFTIFTANIP